MAHQFVPSPSIDRKVLQGVRAAADGDIETLRRLKSAGVNLSLGDYDGRTALHLACAEGHECVVRFLLHECNVDINCRDRWGKTPYEQAQISNQRNVVAIFNEAKIFQAVHAASRGDTETLRRLAADGLDLNLGDYDGRTPLHLACAEGRQAAVRYLVQSYGVETNCKDRWNNTPVDQARQSGHHEIVQIFEEEKILEAINAATKGDLETLRRLKAENVNLGKGDYDGRTPLHLACAEGKIEIIKFLLIECRVETDCKDRWDTTPLEQAAKYGRKDVEKVFDEFLLGDHMLSPLYNA